MATTITNSSQLISNLNNDALFTLNANHEIKAETNIFFKILQKIKDVFTSNRVLEARQKELDTAMESMLRKDLLPNFTTEVIDKAMIKLPEHLQTVVHEIQDRQKLSENIQDLPENRKNIAKNIFEKFHDYNAAVSLCKWRDSNEISPDDLKKFTESLREEQEETIKKSLNEKGTITGIAEQFEKDCYRLNISIGENNYNHAIDKKEELLNTFKKTFPNEKAQKLLSTVMTQSTFNALQGALCYGELPHNQFVPEGLKGRLEFFSMVNIPKDKQNSQPDIIVTKKDNTATLEFNQLIVVKYISPKKNDDELNYGDVNEQKKDPRVAIIDMKIKQTYTDLSTDPKLNTYDVAFYSKPFLEELSKK